MSEVYKQNLLEYRDKLTAHQLELQSQLQEVNRLLHAVQYEMEKNGWGR
jgi:hypothetical protein